MILIEFLLLHLLMCVFVCRSIELWMNEEIEHHPIKKHIIRAIKFFFHFFRRLSRKITVLLQLEGSSIRIVGPFPCRSNLQQKRLPEKTTFSQSGYWIALLFAAALFLIHMRERKKFNSKTSLPGNCSLSLSAFCAKKRRENSYFSSRYILRMLLTYPCTHGTCFSSCWQFIFSPLPFLLPRMPSFTRCLHYV
jgi:hypothetical protein